ncbi:SBBP repeat-containing protein [Hymenobacter volaticus]|uniref:SBBP repeat-containing protein n=1 Tax=Hymenobacter volaticus TaxID=2932254 RepID=A0ABY4G1H7_9BACT|nr:SBBP repeat-containing protein [Hymenobacter volaticus]UOQ64718.1 SBBP repeat-containing protein [Hymenobacter volaticus]
MKQTFTRLLPLAASLLLCVPVSQAQVAPSISTSKAPKGLPTLPQFSLPDGAPALRHALPASRSKVAGEKKSMPSRSVTKFNKRQAIETTATTAITSESVSEEWATRYTRYGTTFGGGTEVVTDAAGSVYVTGNSFGSGSNYDFATVKYSASSVLLWEARYNGPGANVDLAAGIAVDAAGNVYVTGTSVGRGSNGYDYATVKYSSGGQQLWAVRYNGSASGDDLATDIAVDAAGNVYVTGTSYNGSASYDYVTVKYSPSGQQLWAAPYSRSSTSDDLPTDLALDGSGNVVVTGTTYLDNQSDYTTIKYASGSGQQMWEAHYNGPANGYDLVRDLAVDANGNVAVTGTSDDGTGNYDYATAKYSPSGQQTWAVRYNGAGNNYDEATAVALSSTGNVVVTGYSDSGNSNWNYLTFQYAAASGQQLWQAEYNGPDNGYDEAKDVVIDRQGNVAVTGRSYKGVQSDYATVKYAGSSGQQIWQARYTRSDVGNDVAVAVAVDATGNVYVTGDSFNGSDSTSRDYATLKYAASTGQMLWDVRYNIWIVDNTDDVPNDIAVDAAGNVYVTGSSYEANNLSVSSYATIKYSPSGQQLWEVRQRTQQSTYASNPHIAVDAMGSVYVAGNTNNTYLVIKYSSNGQLLWSQNYQFETSTRGTGVAELALDASGNVFVTGFQSTLTGDYDYFTLKYAGDTGQQLWVARYNGPNNGSDQPTGLSLDQAGNVYVTGTSLINGYSSYVYATIKYDGATGQQQWVARFNRSNSTASFEDLPDIAVDKTGNVVVAGVIIIKYDGTNGQPLWTTRFNGNNNPGGGARVGLDANGDVFVTGYFTNLPFRDADWSTTKYDGANGQQLWQSLYNGPVGRGYDQPTDLEVDAVGNVYITGFSFGVGDNFTDYVTVKYAGASGQLAWEARYHGSLITSSRDQPYALALDAVGNVYVTGFSSNSNASNSDYVTVKYSQANGTAATPLVAATRPALAVSTTGQQQLAVYPNPTTGPTTVSFRPVLEGAAQVRVYNQLGQQVATLYEGKVRQGQHYELPLHSEKLSAGLYTCSLLVNGQRETVRLVVTH